MGPYYTVKKIAQIFDRPISKSMLFEAEERGEIPRGKRSKVGAIDGRVWTIDAIPQIGAKWGFLHPFSEPQCFAVFTTKGGVLKTTLSINLARMAALHNIKTCVVGLDMQGDITSAMGHDLELDEATDLKAVIQKLNQTKGLADLFNRAANIDDLICPTEIPTLFYIPETPELAALNESLSTINRREYWLKEKVIRPLKEQFDLIILDCSPNWNRLITNALVACDGLISPLECKINNFRNFKVFRHFLDEFKRDMRLDFEIIFVPTRYSAQKKLSREIWQWYRENVPALAKTWIRESVFGEEATAMRMSVIEHIPSKGVAMEMRQLLLEIYQRMEAHLQQKAVIGEEKHLWPSV